MSRATIVATPEGIAALRARLGQDCVLLPAKSPDEALRLLRSSAGDGARVLLVQVDLAEATEATFADLTRLAPGAAIVAAGDLPQETARERAVVSASGEGLSALASLLLDRFQLKRRAAEDETRLELVSSAGVAMAASFDIAAILERTRAAAREVLEGGDVQVYYGGCVPIGARPRWCPSASGPAVAETARERLERRVREGAVWDAAAEPLALPIAHQGSCLGALLLQPEKPVAADRRKLLEILALQAATALGNIHSAQERIQFERLSAIGRMIGSIVHDFRSPLTALRGYGGMLHALDLDDRERREFASALLEECDRLDHMVEELLQFSRGRGPDIARKLTGLADYLERLTDRVIRHYGQAGVVVEIELDSVRDVEVLVDRERFERALWNVVSNACQAMSAGGHLAIRAKRIGERVGIEIEDDGVGIPEEIRHRIFEPFFSYGKSAGVGLGMATAKRIAEEHEGEIEVESRAGRGTRVRFFLPVPSAASVEETSESEMALPSAKGADR